MTLSDPHVRHGQVCGYCAGPLAERLPTADVVRMTLAEMLITAERAHQVRLVAELYDKPEGVRTAAADWAEKVAANSPTAVLDNLRTLRQPFRGHGGLRQGPSARLSQQSTVVS